MRTCKIETARDLADQIHENAYAVVGPAGELLVYQELDVNEAGHNPIALYAPGSWLKVTYQEGA